MPDLIMGQGDTTSWIGSLVEAIDDFLPALWIYVKQFVGILTGTAIVLSVFFFLVMVYCVERLKVIRKKESEIYDVKVEPAYEEVDKHSLELAKRWNKAEANVQSDNENDWKQAIIESDKILDELMSKLGYRGESVGEKLQRVAKGDMKTLDSAWEAHKIRNEIAHNGGFKLEHHVAKRAMAMYRKVFEEFYYI